MSEEKSDKKDAPKEGVVLNSQDSKLKAALSCIPVVGLILYFIEQQDTRVRFYSAQGILIGIIGIIIELIPFINLFGWIIIIAAIVMTAMKAYQTEENYKLPIIGDYAEKLAAKKF